MNFSRLSFGHMIFIWGYLFCIAVNLPTSIMLNIVSPPKNSNWTLGPDVVSKVVKLSI